MKILVVDPNRAFSKKIKSFIQCNMCTVEVDTADNVFVLRDRVKSKTYDLIIADVISALNPDDLLRELENLSTPKLVWTMTQDWEGLKVRVRETIKGKIINKPNSMEELDRILMTTIKALRPVSAHDCI